MVSKGTGLAGVFYLVGSLITRASLSTFVDRQMVMPFHRIIHGRSVRLGTEIAVHGMRGVKKVAELESITGVCRRMMLKQLPRQDSNLRPGG